MDAKGAVPPGKISRSWMIGFFALVLVLYWASCPRKQTSPNLGVMKAPASTYDPNRICPMPAATDVPYVNPNDHRHDPAGEFTVEVPHGCFSSNADWVMPATNRGGWIEDIVSDDPNAQVAIWFSGMGHPLGPYTRATFPHDYHWNEWRLQAIGNGSVKVRYVYTGMR